MRPIMSTHGPHAHQIPPPNGETLPTVSSAVAEALVERAGRLFGLMSNGKAHLTGRGLPFTSARHKAATAAMSDAYYRANGRISAPSTTDGRDSPTRPFRIPEPRPISHHHRPGVAARSPSRRALTGPTPCSGGTNGISHLSRARVRLDFAVRLR